MTSSTEPSDRDLLVAEWQVAKPQRDRGTDPAPGLLAAHAAWACEAFGSTAVMAAWEWTPQELSALLSTEMLGATKVRISAST